MVLRIGTAMGEWALVMLAAKLGVKMPTFMVVPINSVRNYLGVGRGTLIGTLSKQVKPAVKEFFANKNTRLSKKVIPYKAPGWNKDLQKALGNPEVASLVRQFMANKINRRVVYGSLVGIGIAPQIIEAIIDMRSDTEKWEPPVGMGLWGNYPREPALTSDVRGPYETPFIDTISEPSLAEESARERVLDKHLDQPRPFDDLPVDTTSQYTRGEALRITNQMAANRDPNWKAFWKEEEDKGFSDKEDPSLIEDIKKVAEYLTKDRPKRDRERVRPRTGRKKGGVVNKRVTKQYAKGGSVRTPKRVK